ncbi:sensor domain-containing protein [Acetobacter sp.]|uniref:sensor domain-containing protein n=1 Tax=Acetobacter sp. TaxID=440 RepID=UPI0039EAB988
MRVVFPFIAQPHQTLHSLPIAFEMALRHPEIDVHVACLTPQHLSYIQSLAALYPPAFITYELLKMPDFLRRRIESRGPEPLTKLLVLLLNRSYFSHFQAIVVPERTSLYLKRMGLRNVRFIWTRHGAGDRAIGFAKDVKLFDFVLLAGKKVEERLLAQGAIKPGHYHRGVYAKLDIVRRMRQDDSHLFSNDRPTILYNPHFSSSLSSWPTFGERILQYFANQDKYNLIFAPHYRLFNHDEETGEALIRQFEDYPHMLIDPGSTRSIDMTYTMAADLYLGDVSSQVAEFLIRPRPCLFLNAHNANWQNNPNYAFWHLGEVINDPLLLPEALDRAFSLHPQFEAQQKAYVAETFEFPDDGPTAPGAADAIVDFLRRPSHV